MRVGQRVTRYLSGTIPMELVVHSFDEEVFYVTTPGHLGVVENIDDVCWKFDRRTGAEIDERFGWVPGSGTTGSLINMSELEDD